MAKEVDNIRQESVREAPAQIVTLWSELTSEVGQTATEYTAMTAVALLTAILLTWTLLSGALGSALGSMFDRFTDFMANPPGF